MENSVITLSMKRIGLIGGIGPESTIEYYRLLIKGYQESLQTTHYPEILLQTVDMTEMLTYAFGGELDKLVDFLKGKIARLEKAGVDYVALTSNTPHLVFDELQAEVAVKLISIVEETSKQMVNSATKKVGLLGTKSTMTKGFYQRVAAHHGIEIVIPSEEHQDYIHTKYMNELLYNHIVSETKAQLIQIIRGLQSQEAIEGIILGGTELPLILQQTDFHDLRVFNTTEIHVDAILQRMMAE